MKLNMSAVSLTLLALPALALAQVNPAFSELTEATEQARSIVQTERKMIISDGLGLTAEESTAFWPIYDRYAAELKTAGDLRVKVITDYAASYEQSDRGSAKQLIADSLKYQEKVLNLRKQLPRQIPQGTARNQAGALLSAGKQARRHHQLRAGPADPAGAGRRPMHCIMRTVTLRSGSPSSSARTVTRINPRHCPRLLQKRLPISR